MARTHSSVGTRSGALGDVIYYTRFGKTFVRRRAESFNDCQSEAQLRQRALFKAMQQTSALFGIILQRGLTKYAHSQGHTEANEFASINKQHFTFSDGVVHINYPALQLAIGPLPPVTFIRCHANGLHVQLSFSPDLAADKANPDDVVHIYAVSPQAEVCQLMVSVERHAGQTSFTLPDLRGDVDNNVAVTFYLYAIVESATTSCIPTLSADEKRVNKQYRNINRRVSNAVYIDDFTIDY